MYPELTRGNGFLHPQAASVELTRARRASLIHSSGLFADLPAVECDYIAERARPRSFHRHEFVFRQGRPFRHLVLLESGCSKLTYLGVNGNEVIMAVRGVGEAIDLPAGFTNCYHVFSAQAMVPCTALTWDLPTLETFMVATPQLRTSICRILCDQLSELQERYYELCVDRVSRRLACTLIRLEKHVGIHTGQGTEIYITRQELAQMTGTTVFTVSRLITKWAELGFLTPRREALLVRNPAGLDLQSSALKDSLE